MSTIEKAAARLATRQRGTSPPEPVQPAREIGPLRPAAGPSPARFCDLDLEQLRQRGFLTPAAPRTALAQEMRRIKRPLLLNIQRAIATEANGTAQPPANLIMITSALPGEGKTFISINLAMSMAAELDHRVLLVDADIARGDLSQQLGIHAERGLSDLLRENSYLSEEGVLTTNVERLSVLPAGPAVDNVDELFASAQMALIARALADADPNRVIIFDASPLLATTEAAVLAQRMGQTVMVVEANQTPQDAVGQALTQLDGCANVSLVLNKTTGKDAGGYGYGYGYGAYGQDTTTAAAEAD
jgi:exopolysaccharide/PEP-CTERM locus tyrosine autokinase